MKKGNKQIAALEGICWLAVIVLTLLNHKLAKEYRWGLCSLVGWIILLCLMVAFSITFIRWARRIEAQEENEKKDEDKGE